MSWIQDFFQRLKKDDEEEIDDYTIHKSNSQPFLNKNESLKDLDTKISYQYPKGSYRPSHPPVVVQRERKKHYEK
ncbi:MAG: hypothetical protein K6T88_04635 [Bacillus sp. (in: Bacteria)]|nr:hypothetical protein [Bacillus sp. (in: firmicutes)]